MNYFSRYPGYSLTGLMASLAVAYFPPFDSIKKIKISNSGLPLSPNKNNEIIDSWGQKYTRDSKGTIRRIKGI